MAALNTLHTTTWRNKYRSNMLDQALRNMLVAEKICAVDRSDTKYIYNPYGSTPSVTVQALTNGGTYSTATYQTHEDTLTVSDEFIVAEHVYDFEQTLSNFDIFASRTDEMVAAVAAKIDYWVLNNLCEDGTGTYTTPTGGFTTASNFNTIMANLLAGVSGYADNYKGLFIVLENTDLTGVIAAQATNGFSMADSALRNGLVGTYMGIDIYVVRTGTFANATSGSTTFTNSGHRVFGVKGVTTYAAPRGIKWEEKPVAGRTGREIVCNGYIGFRAWTVKAGLITDITLA